MDESSVLLGSQHETHSVIYISGLDIKQAQEHEELEGRGAREAVLHSVAKLVAAGNTEVHLVSLNLLQVLWESGGWAGGAASGSAGAASVEGDGWGGSCYVHTYSCLPEMAIEKLNFAEEIGCQLLGRASGFNVVLPSLDMNTDKWRRGRRFHGLPLAAIQLIFLIPRGEQCGSVVARVAGPFFPPHLKLAAQCFVLHPRR